MDAKTIGTRIRVARQRKGWTQRNLATQLAVAQSRVSNWEAGKRLPGLKEIVRLSGVLQQPVSALVDGSPHLQGSLYEELAWFGLPVSGRAGRAFWAVRPPETVLVAALAQPSPRIVDRLAALPLSRPLSLDKLVGEARAAGVLPRLGWLLDVAHSLRIAGVGTPGWPLPRVRLGDEAHARMDWDSLGSPAPDRRKLGPAWKRWRIDYDRTLRDLTPLVRETLQEIDRGR